MGFVEREGADRALQQADHLSHLLGRQAVVRELLLVSGIIAAGGLEWCSRLRLGIVSVRGGHGSQDEGGLPQADMDGGCRK